jgi:hypothetical protein
MYGQGARGRELPMNRQEAVLLLKEMAAVCGSFHDAQLVSIEKNKKSNSWELHVNSIPHPSEVVCLEKIVDSHGLEMVTINGSLVFRVSKNS